VCFGCIFHCIHLLISLSYTTSSPRFVHRLETALRDYSALLKDSNICVYYNDHKYWFTVLETQPADVISIVETDVEVDFAPSVEAQLMAEQQKRLDEEKRQQELEEQLLRQSSAPAAAGGSSTSEDAATATEDTEMLAGVDPELGSLPAGFVPFSGGPAHSLGSVRRRNRRGSDLNRSSTLLAAAASPPQASASSSSSSSTSSTSTTSDPSLSAILSGTTDDRNRPVLQSRGSSQMFLKKRSGSTVSVDGPSTSSSSDTLRKAARGQDDTQTATSSPVSPTASSFVPFGGKPHRVGGSRQR